MDTDDDRLLPRWISLCERCSLRGDVAEAGHDLLARYNEPHRRYHNAKHLADCLRELDSYLELAAEPAFVEMSLWFHDAVYVVGAKDNEERCADLAARTLSGLGAAHGLLEFVRTAVVATKHQTAPPPGDASLGCDIDLSILAAAPGRYTAYAGAILAESGLAVEVFRPLRLAFLEAMLAREQIFHTPAFRAAGEQSARRNMQQEALQIRGQMSGNA